MPQPSTALVEQQIRDNADPALLDLLDKALRDVADICRTNSIPLPALLGVFLHDRSIELALVDDIELPAPWQRDAETSAWTITADDELDPPLTTVSPYPALVEIGEIEGGSRLLLNLEQLSHLGIAAPTAEARDIIRALAVFLAFSPLGDNLKLTLVGTGEALARPNTDGSALIEYAPTADAVLERLARHTRTDAQALADNGIDDIAQARIEYTDSAITNPEIILLSEPLTTAQREIFDNILANAPRVAFAAVTAADDPTADWTLTTGTDGSATLRRPGRPAFDLTPARISEAEFDAIIDVLETADADPIADAASQNDPWTAETFDDRIAEATSVDDLLPHQAPTVHILATEPNFDTATTEFDDTEADTEPLTYLDPADESSINNTPDTAENTPPIAMAIAPTPDNTLSVDEHIWIHVLGTPRVTALNEGSDVGRRPHLTELAALIATHPHPGIRGPQVDEKIWPKQTYADLSFSEQTTKRTARRNTAFTRLRNFLGETAHRRPRLPQGLRQHRQHPIPPRRHRPHRLGHLEQPHRRTPRHRRPQRTDHSRRPRGRNPVHHEKSARTIRLGRRTTPEHDLRTHRRHRRTLSTAPTRRRHAHRTRTRPKRPRRRPNTTKGSGDSRSSQPTAATTSQPHKASSTHCSPNSQNSTSTPTSRQLNYSKYSTTSTTQPANAPTESPREHPDANQQTQRAQQLDMRKCDVQPIRSPNNTDRAPEPEAPKGEP